MNLVWLVLGIVGAVVLYLVLSGDGAATFGLENSKFAEVALMSMWGALIAAAVIPRKGEIREAARNAAIWILVIIMLAGGYIFRYDLQDVASRMTAGLVPGSPRTVQATSGEERVVLSKADGEHFLARMEINGITTSMLVDTGATSIVLTGRDAEAIGIDVANLDYTVPTQTANGLAYAARARVETVKLGTIRRQNVSVYVARSNALNQSLLGMNFLNSLTAFEFRGDELYLTD